MVNRNRCSLVFCTICFLVMVVSSLAAAQEVSKTTGGASTEKSYNDWHFLFYLPGWLAGMNGNVAAKGREAGVDVSIWQSVKNLQYLESMAMGHLEVKKGPWGILLEGLYMKLGENTDSATKIKLPIGVPVQIPVSGRIKAYSEMSFDEGAVLYDVYRQSSGVGNRAVLTVEALAGARYMYFRTKIDADVKGPLGNIYSTGGIGKRDWVDPIVGGRLSWNLSDRWMFGFRTDVGGFGASSDFTWNVDAMLKYRMNKWLNMYGGFRALYEKHEEGSGSDKFKYDVWLYGPWLGLGVEF